MVTLENTQWPYLPVLERMLLALALGLFVGIERERRSKVAGLRTFGFAALLGALGGVLGDNYALLIVASLAVLVVLLNLHTLRLHQSTELTTSVALLVTGFVGSLCGKGHTLTPAAVGVTTAALLRREAKPAAKITPQKPRGHPSETPTPSDSPPEQKYKARGPRIADPNNI